MLGSSLGAGPMYTDRTSFNEVFNIRSEDMIKAFQGLLRLAFAVIAIFMAMIGYFSLDNKTVSGAASCTDLSAGCTKDRQTILCGVIVENGEPTQCWKATC
jgi:hypothetical protein